MYGICITYLWNKVLKTNSCRPVVRQTQRGCFTPSTWSAPSTGQDYTIVHYSTYIYILYTYVVCM